MGLHRLDNAVMPYAWGSRSALARLRGAAPTATPEAELWIGAHPKAPSRLAGGTTLAEHVAADPVRVLGAETASRFDGELPFLLKLLAAERPLSLKAHPSAEQAAAGYERENAEGIPLDAPFRNYRDPHHKPEIICAISHFEALAGLRPPLEIAALFERMENPALGRFISSLRGPEATLALRDLLEHLYGMESEELRPLLEAVSGACARLRWSNDPEARHLGWSLELGAAYPGDVGAVVALLLNHVKLAPGQAIYLAPGHLHAYLQGFGIELMACSDNVLRGGLTSKHMDAPELMSLLRFDGRRVVPLARIAEGRSEVHYDVDVPEFRLSAVRPRSDGPVHHKLLGPEAIVCVEGTVSVTAGTECIDLTPGQSVFCEAATGAYVLGGSGLAYRASVGAVHAAKESTGPARAQEVA